jgi:esterase/lipase superfamily enzyme
LDAERFKLVESVRPLVEAGRIKLYAVEDPSRYAWTRRDVPAAQKVAAQDAYDRYLTDELVPFVRHDCGGTDQRFGACGASLGAYQAFNAVSRHPDIFELMVGMSGTYVLDRRLGGYWDETYYFHQPTQFVPNLADGPLLDALRRCVFVFGLGQQFENPGYTYAAAHALRARQVPHHVETWWAPDTGHDWPTWRRMLPLFLGKLA